MGSEERKKGDERGRKKKSGFVSGKGRQPGGERVSWHRGDNKMCPGFSDEKNTTDGCHSPETERSARKTKKTGQRVEWMARKKGNDRGARKKKGDDSGKGGELIGEGECWDGGDAATIRSALCLVKTKKAERTATCSEWSERKAKRRVAHGGEKPGPVSGWWTRGHG